MATIPKTIPKVSRVIGRPNNGLKRSMMAKTMARKVLATLSNDKPVVLKSIAKTSGYSDSMASAPSKIVNTLSYQEEITPYLNKILALRDKAINDLGNRKLSDEKMFDITMLVKTLDHNINLLQGKSTENVAVKTEITVFGSDDFLSKQLARMV